MGDAPEAEEISEEEQARLEEIRRVAEASWKKASKQLKGKDIGTLLSATKACNTSFDYLNQGGCLIPLVELLKKPKGKWAKKNYPSVQTAALTVLHGFLSAEPDPIPVPEPPAAATAIEGNESAAPTAPPIPVLAPRHPNIQTILTEISKKKKQCKIKGADKFHLNLAHKDLAISLLSLSCVSLIVKAAESIDDKTKVPKGKKQVLLDPFGKERKGIIKKVGTGTVKNLSKLLPILVERLGKEGEGDADGGDGAVAGGKADGAESNSDGSLPLPPLLSTKSALSTSLSLVSFCLSNNKDALSHLIKCGGVAPLLSLLKETDFRASATKILEKVVETEKGKTAMTLAEGVERLQEVVLVFSKKIAEEGDEQGKAIETAEGLLAMLNKLTSFIAAENKLSPQVYPPPVDVDVDVDAGEGGDGTDGTLAAEDAPKPTFVIPIPQSITETAQTLNSILSLPFSLSLAGLNKSCAAILGSLAEINDDIRVLVKAVDGTLPNLLRLLSTPKMLGDVSTDTPVEEKTTKKEDKKGKKGKKEVVEEEPAIAPPPETPREGDPIGYDVRRAADKALSHLIVSLVSGNGSDDVLDAGAGGEEDTSAETTSTNLLSAANFIAAMNSVDRDIAGRAIRLAYLVSMGNDGNARKLGKGAVGPLVKALRWNIISEEGKIEKPDDASVEIDEGVKTDASVDIDDGSIATANTLERGVGNDPTKVEKDELTIFCAELLGKLAANSEEANAVVGDPTSIQLLAGILSTRVEDIEATPSKQRKYCFSRTTLSNAAHNFGWDFGALEEVGEPKMPKKIVSVSVVDALTQLCRGERLYGGKNAADTEEDDPAAEADESGPGGEIPGAAGAISSVDIGTLPIIQLLGYDIQEVSKPSLRRPMWGAAAKKRILPTELKLSLVRFVGAAAKVTGGRAAMCRAAFKEGWKPAIYPKKEEEEAVEVVVEVEKKAKKGEGKKKKKKKKGPEEDKADVEERMWEEPTGFLSFGSIWMADEDEVQQPSIDEAAWPFVRVASCLLHSICFSTTQENVVVGESMRSLVCLTRDVEEDQGDQSVLADIFAGVTVSMGGLISLISIIDGNKFKYEKFDSVTTEVAHEHSNYLARRGVDREQHWASMPVVVEKEEEVVAAPVKGKKDKKTKGKPAEPDPAEDTEEVDVPQFGVEDPNCGPTKGSWSELIDSTGFDVVNDIERSSALISAAVTSDEKAKHALIANLLNNGANPNCSSADRTTPLMYAVVQNDVISSKALIDAGANMDIIGPKGATALKVGFCVADFDALDGKVCDLRLPNRPKPEVKKEYVVPKLVIAGAPASGKGTQCEEIKAKYGVVHLSTGDMLRAAVAAESEVGLKAKECMEAGGLVPDDVICSIVLDRLKEQDCTEKGWLLDGFPRTQTQALALEDAGFVANCMLLLDVNDEILTDRVLGRRTDSETGEIYHMTTNPPPNEEIAARLVARSDDTEEIVKVRLENYHENIGNVIGVYEGIVTSESVEAARLAASESEVEVSATESEAENEDDNAGDGSEQPSEPGSELEQTTNMDGGGEAILDTAVPEDSAVVDQTIPANLIQPSSRVFRVDGDRDPHDISIDIFAKLKEVTNWEGKPTHEEEEMAHGATMIQGVFRTRQAKRKMASMKVTHHSFDEGRMAATVAGLPKMVQFLIDQGADVNISDDDGNFPLHWALSGATIDLKFRGASMTFKGPVKDEQLLDILAQAGADMDVCNMKGETLLHTALNSGDTHAALRLLDAGAHPNAMDADGLLPIHHACMSASPGFDELVEVLLRNGNGKGVFVASHQDLRKGKSGEEKLKLTLEGIMDSVQAEALCPLSITQRLVTKSDILQLVTKEGYTALHYSAGSAGDSDGDIDIPSRVALLERLLMDDAVNINVADDTPPGAGANSLICSIKMLGEIDICKVLVDHKIDIDAVEDVGDGSGLYLTALHYAVQKHNDIAEYLLECGASPLVAKTNPPALNWAVQHNSTVIGQLMEKASAIDPQFINVVDDKKQTSLHVAAECGNIEALKIIVNAPNLDIDAVNGDGNNALHIGINKCNVDAVEILLSNGADIFAKNGQGVSAVNMSIEGGPETLPAALLLIKKLNIDIIEKTNLLELVEGQDMSFGQAAYDEKVVADEKKFEDLLIEEKKDDEGNNIAGTAGPGDENNPDSSPSKPRAIRKTLNSSSVQLTNQEIAINLVKSTTPCQAAACIAKAFLEIEGVLQCNKHIHECYKDGELFFDYSVRVAEEERIKAALVIQQQARERAAKKNKKKENKRSSSSRKSKKSPKKK